MSPDLLSDFKNAYTVFVRDYSCAVRLEVGKALVRALPSRCYKPELNHCSTPEEVWSNCPTRVIREEYCALCTVLQREPGVADATVSYRTICTALVISLVHPSR